MCLGFTFHESNTKRQLLHTPGQNLHPRETWQKNLVRPKHETWNNHSSMIVRQNKITYSTKNTNQHHPTSIRTGWCGVGKYFWLDKYLTKLSLWFFEISVQQMSCIIGRVHSLVCSQIPHESCQKDYKISGNTLNISLTVSTLLQLLLSLWTVLISLVDKNLKMKVPMSGIPGPTQTWHTCVHRTDRP